MKRGNALLGLLALILGMTLCAHPVSAGTINTLPGNCELATSGSWAQGGTFKADNLFLTELTLKPNMAELTRSRPILLGTDASGTPTGPVLWQGPEVITPTGEMTFYPNVPLTPGALYFVGLDYGRFTNVVPVPGAQVVRLAARNDNPIGDGRDRKYKAAPSWLWEPFDPVVDIAARIVMTNAVPKLTTEEHQITAASKVYNLPALGADSIGPIVVYQSLVMGQNNLLYQRLTADGAPSGDPVLVTVVPYNADISGGRIVYKAIAAGGQKFVLYDIATNTHTVLVTATYIVNSQIRIHGDKVVWNQDDPGMIMLYDINNLGSNTPPTVIFGPSLVSYPPEIGDRFVVWHHNSGSGFDVYAYDLQNKTVSNVSNDQTVSNLFPTSSGPWVVWQVNISGRNATRIEAKNLDTGELRVVADNGAESLRPTIDGDVIAYESSVSGNSHIYVYQISTGRTFQVTTNASNQRNGDNYGDLIAYSDYRNFNSGYIDVWVTKFRFPVINTAPVLEPIANATVQEGQPLEFAISAIDADGDALSYTASNLPTGAIFDPSTRTFSWTPSYNQAGSYDVLFTVTDNASPPASASQTVTITVGNVNQSPVLNPIGNKGVNEGQLLEFTVTATDPDGDGFTFSAGNLPAGASFDPITGKFSWIPDYNQAGNYQVTFNVTDKGTPPASAAGELITITVGNVNRPPVLAAIGNKSVNEGQLLEFTITATDSDGDGLTYSATGLPPGATFDPTLQKFSWTPGYDQAENGPYSVEFTVTDNGSPVELDVEIITITVGNVNRAPVFNPIGSQQTLENQRLTFSVSATDSDGDAVSYSVGQLPAGATFDAASRSFSWTPSNSQAGTYTVSFYAADSGLPQKTGRIDVMISVGDVPTVSELSNQLVQTIIGLSLAKQVENSYLANLKKVVPFIELGLTTDAINQLDAFIKKVKQGILRGDISQAVGNNLIGMGSNLITVIQG